jgi:predicted DNA-binding protein
MVDIHIQYVYTQRMIRTQMYISEKAHKNLVALAEAKGEPMAKIVRDILEERFENVGASDYSGKQALRSLLKLQFRGGPKDLSTNLDYYLYGAPKREVETQ